MKGIITHIIIYIINKKGKNPVKSREQFPYTQEISSIGPRNIMAITQLAQNL